MPARLLLAPGQAIVQDGAPGGTPLTFAEVQALIEGSASEVQTPRSAPDAPLGSPLVELQGEDWIENGWGPSLDYFVAARHALISREHDAPVHAAPLTDTSVAQQLRRRTHRTYARTADGATSLGAIEQICALLRRWEPADELSASVLTYDDGSGRASARTIGRGGDDVRPLGTTTDTRAQMQRAMAGMQAALTASTTVVFLLDVAVFTEAPRDDFSLIERLIEVGELAQVIVALGESLGYGALVTPGFSDCEVTDLLQFQPSQIPVYSATLGPKRTSTPATSIR